MTPLNSAFGLPPRGRHARPTRCPAQQRRRYGIALIATAATLSLAGCAIPGLPGATGAPDIQRVAATGARPANTTPTAGASVSASASPSPTAAPTAAATPAATTTAAGPGAAVVAPPAAPAWVPVANDLRTGSVTHRVDAAAHTLVIDYWTTEDPASWTPDSAPLIRLNAHIDGPDYGNAIKVTRFNVRADSLAAVLANDAGEFTVAPPFAYSSGVVVPPNPKAHSTQLLFTFDLLTETAPGSGVFARQTVLDTLTIGYAKPGSAAGASATPSPN
ncbi:hypothetical protein ACRQ5B_09135 [Pseudarthrobacter sp. L19]|uniref:hypothetical protein n=1 Tax=Pseudarthrobacter sp. L19 TaxID=3423951 RepID=UPI003D790EDA